MSKKYVGIKHPSTGSSNFGLVFELKEDGKYHCINWKSNETEFVYTQEQIDHDLKHNYIKEYTNANN